jgi:hypothetical protein
VGTLECFWLDTLEDKLGLREQFRIDPRIYYKVWPSRLRVQGFQLSPQTETHFLPEDQGHFQSTLYPHTDPWCISQENNG